MFPSFIGILDVQSWWEIPSIAYFCSLFRSAFNLLDFDIEELEEALLTDGTEESASSLLTELIVRLLNGCLGNNDISAFNYQVYLRRLFRRKCQETNRYNPFNTDMDFQFLPLRTKVEILYALCDFRLDAEDVFDLFKNLEAESLRVEPLGWDDNDSAYWYFYGTRLYREDIIKKSKGKNKKKKIKENKKRGWFYGDDWLDDDETERVWQVVCFTEEDWAHLTEKFSKATSKVEKELYRSLSQNFLPEIPRLFQEKERLQRKRLLELAPRRTSSRVLQKIKQKEEETKQTSHDNKEDIERKETPDIARENRAKRRSLLRSKSISSDSSASAKEEMPQKISNRCKSQDKQHKNSTASQKGEPPPEMFIKSGRKTNNSLASATGQILIPDNDEPVNSTRKKLKTSQIFSQTEEDIQTDMYKVLEQLTAHEDAWPFMDPVEEEYAPNYYAVIRRPMDLHKMEERLDTGYYTDFSMFKSDFKLIVNNCRLYNGQDNEYTLMVDNLQAAFDRLTEKYLHRVSSSDEEIAVEYQIPTPSRKHKLKLSESPSHHKRKKRKSDSDAGDPKSSSSDPIQDEKQPEKDVKKSKESHKSKQGKKKRKGHHRHGKHSRNHKKDSHKSEHSESSKHKHSKKQKHTKNKDDRKKAKQKKKKSKHHENVPIETLKKSISQESLESSNRSRSASPLPSIHTPTPSPTELDQSEQVEQVSDPEFHKDKYDKIKERRRHAVKDAWESLFDYKQKTVDKQKQNLNLPEKDKNQKLRETIEKLKAKNEKYKESSLFNSLFTSNQSITDSKSEVESEKNSKEPDKEIESGDSHRDSKKNKNVKKGIKKNSGKNESASEALEEAVKDISKWLDDAPKVSTTSSPCDSPAQTISTEEHENSRLDDEFSQCEKSSITKKDISRKRPSSREPKFVKRREIQRTIDRLQPGKSKGNLLTNITNKSIEKVEEVIPSGLLNKTRDTTKAEEFSPKLSLGSVLPTVEFSLGNDHNFVNNEENKPDEVNDINKIVEERKDDKMDDVSTIKKAEDVQSTLAQNDAEVETEPTVPSKPSQEKATPNLSAWFKAFGAPKNTGTVTISKKKVDDTETEDKSHDNTNDTKSSPQTTGKFDSSVETETPNPEGGDSPLPNVTVTLRQRRTSTGSSVSERSSFSQDLDSPRHQMSHTSPLLRSPASPRILESSPRTDEFQKISYPIINGTVRAGFYQDTTSIKSSPEKSCSPREAPQSPFSPYSQHVYASNNATGSATPNYFVDHTKSPLPTYGQNPPPYYDTSKVPVVTKTARNHEDYIALGPDSYQQNQYTGPFTPTYSPYPQNTPTSYSPLQHSSQPRTVAVNQPTNTSQVLPEQKAAHFPVKKRTYNEPDPIPTKEPETKEAEITVQKENELQQKVIQQAAAAPNAAPTHNITSTSASTVDEIATALVEKSELGKLNISRETKSLEYIDRHPIGENRDSIKYESIGTISENKNINTEQVNKANSVASHKDNIDMINMGYTNPEVDRRTIPDAHVVDVNFTIPRDTTKATPIPHQKSYDVDAIAINLGINTNQPLQKTLSKAHLNMNIIPPAHSQERSHTETCLNQTIPQAHNNQYSDSISSGQSLSNFSINDIEIANKKFYSCSNDPTNAAIDYGSWKMTNHIKKPDVLPSDFSSTYSSNGAEKLKAELNAASSNALNYNKTLQHQQYTAYNVSRANIHRNQELQQSLPAELRIPNPRGLLKNDLLNVSSAGNTDLLTKNIDSVVKSQKVDKIVQNHPLINTNPYKVPYSNTSSLPLDTIRNLPNIPQMLERYTNDERYLTTFANNSATLYDKQFQMAQLYNKGIASDVHPASTSVSMYTQPSISISKDSSGYKNSSIGALQTELKTKSKRKRSSDAKLAQIVGSQPFPTPCSTDVLTSVKTNMMPGNAFNYSPTPNIGLGSGLYGDNSGFSMEDFRNSTATQIMAANYMVAAVAHQQRNNVEGANVDKIAKPAHQNSSHSHTTAFPFIGHSQVGTGYPFDPSSPLYQQYFQRHQEELLRQTGAQIISLYPPGYAASLGVRQPYDSINRPTWH